MIYLWLIIVLSCSLCTKLGEARFKPILISCGTSQAVTSGGRTWIGDESAPNLTISFAGDVSSTPLEDGNSIHGRVYSTARIFNRTSNYTFKLSPGDYFLRLHFYPILLEKLNINDSMFGVAANSLRLLSQFNATSEISRQNSYLQSLGSNLIHASSVKEYFIDVGADGLLIVKFSPEVSSFAYISAMEVIPVLQPLFSDSVPKVSGNGANFSMDKKGMETMYRLNVGGSEIELEKDDLWRKWDNDYPYMFAADASRQISNASNISYVSSDKFLAAPLLVYADARIMTNAEVMEKRFNLSWKFEVSPNFDYLVRFHFCELQYDSANRRAFRIYISNRTASDNFDVYVKARGENKAFYQDYVDSLSQRVDTLWIQLGPDVAAAASDTDALLNGLEIFKISRDGNLAYIYEASDAGNKEASHGKSKNRVLFAVVGGTIVVIALIVVSCASFCCFCRGKVKTTLEKNQPAGWRPLFLHATVGSTNDARSSKLMSNWNGSMATNRIGRRFTATEIRTATKNFDESLVIGTGGFGKVYKGEIDDGTLVAIKRANPQSEQGLAEFETEIETLSKLRHRHLVSMIGFCEEQHEMILVYEYMANGTLRSHLFGNDLAPLSWKQRLEACIGAARGLHYLHTGAEGGIIHRDVKTTNILLDENFVGKVADFGLSKTGPALDRTHVSTAVKGSFGYLDPEYFLRQRLTEKSDVYSFGVVLFEVVCGRPVINPSLPKEQINLVEWALKCQSDGLLETIVDPKLEEAYSLDSLRKFGNVAEKCLADEGKKRPTMGEVLWHLEYVLQLHEASLSTDDDCFPRSEVRFTNALYNLPNIEEMGSPNSSNDGERPQELKCVAGANLPADIDYENAAKGGDFPENVDRFGK